MSISILKKRASLTAFWWLPRLSICKAEICTNYSSLSSISLNISCIRELGLMLKKWFLWNKTIEICLRMHFRTMSPRLPGVAWKEKVCSDHMQITEEKMPTLLKTYHGFSFLWPRNSLSFSLLKHLLVPRLCEWLCCFPILWGKLAGKPMGSEKHASPSRSGEPETWKASPRLSGKDIREGEA